jgi:hypothetical protein
MPPDGDLMLGASRTTVNGVVREFEQVRIAWKDKRLVYTANPSGQAQDHGADSLVARIEGPGPKGTTGFDFPMRRVGCTAP